MLGIARLFGCISVAALMAGCAYGSRQRGDWTRLHSSPSEPSSTPPVRTPGEPSAATNRVALPAGRAPVYTNPTSSPLPKLLESKWVRLGDWARANLGITPKRVIKGAGAAYSLETGTGALVLTPATRLAVFEGVTFWLGYAPVWTDDDCLVHEVDLRKNILPLLTAAAFPVSPGTIVIDPGHGGNNLGTRSVLPDLYEKELTLDWALRLEPLLKRQGWNVVLTRRDDRELSPAERVQVADRHDADLFLSLHFNSAFPQTQQSGLETFCTTPAGLPSTLTRGYEDDANRVFPNNAHDEDNLRYAVRLHRALLERGGMPDRSVRRARFMGVLRTQQRPAILLEAGYLSNPEEARRAATPEYRQRLAEAVVNGLAAPPALASSTRDDRRQKASE